MQIPMVLRFMHMKLARQVRPVFLPRLNNVTYSHMYYTYQVMNSQICLQETQDTLYSYTNKKDLRSMF
jgi:hypothetical protein